MLYSVVHTLWSFHRFNIITISASVMSSLFCAQMAHKLVSQEHNLLYNKNRSTENWTLEVDLFNAHKQDNFAYVHVTISWHLSHCACFVDSDYMFIIRAMNAWWNHNSMLARSVPAKSGCYISESWCLNIWLTAKGIHHELDTLIWSNY